MESSKVGYWLQVGANIGIVMGLVLVALHHVELADPCLNQQRQIAHDVAGMSASESDFARKG